MPISEFDQRGNLPPGEHVASWDQFAERFGYNARRATILASIETWLTHMKAAGCRRVWIDGSFVTAKKIPGDYDACWDATGVRATDVDPDLLGTTRASQLATKQKFGGDIRPDMVSPPGSIMPYLTFFQRDRDGNRKGIVRFDLEDFRR
jgi:hypothetical protein